ncbi:MAG: betaine/proline/choline family ABC transporter ATP-binding protein [Methanosarcinales archaeon]|nr:betaine/proline/choline family ABC transporter ATP-binding protein [ANME-2 cluster archaeon]MDW7776687.1 betaine/proline/choline family ABC transporter ATP-binding protein [Methanosarcinales archaeon]
MPTQRLFDRIDSVHLQQVTKKYDERFAVEQLDLDLLGGELLILIGPSGSGKTTTLRMINRLIEPDEGIITINDHDIMEFDPVRLRRNIGYVIQDIGLFPHMTIKENIGLVPRLEGWSDQDISDRVSYLLDFVSLPPESFMDRYPEQLSGGQQQRVGLARALAMDPPLLLMDEPFGALDPILRKQLQDEFNIIKQEIGRTILFVTHDIDEAFKLGDRIGVMSDAKLVQIGTPEELILHPENELVSDIVDAKRKFKHMDTLKVKDMMSPIIDKYLFDAGTTIQEAIKRMTQTNMELVIVLDGSVTLGYVAMTDLVQQMRDDVTLGDIARPTPSFSSNDHIASALGKLKDSGESLGVVMEAERPIGLFFLDNVLMRLI